MLASGVVAPPVGPVLASIGVVLPPEGAAASLVPPPLGVIVAALASRVTPASARGVVPGVLTGLVPLLPVLLEPVLLLPVLLEPVLLPLVPPEFDGALPPEPSSPAPLSPSACSLDPVEGSGTASVVGDCAHAATRKSPITGANREITSARLRTSTSTPPNPRTRCIAKAMPQYIQSPHFWSAKLYPYT